MGTVAPYVDETQSETMVKIILSDVFTLIGYLIQDRILSDRKLKNVNIRLNELLAEIIEISASGGGYKNLCYDALKWIETSLKEFIIKSEENELYESAANLKKVLDEHFEKIN